MQLKVKKNLENQKEKIKLILENISKKEGTQFIENYKKAINSKLDNTITAIIGIDEKNNNSRVEIDNLKEQIKELYNNIKSLTDESKIQESQKQKKELSKKYTSIFKTFNISSKQIIKLINEKGYLLNFKEFMDIQTTNYEDSEKLNELMEKIINFLGTIETTDEKKFVADKKTVKDKIRTLIEVGDTNPDEYLRKYALIKKLNIQVIYTIDKIISESLNAISVFIKARKEGTTESDRYGFDKTCVTIKRKDGKGVSRYGQFKNILDQIEILEIYIVVKILNAMIKFL